MKPVKPTGEMTVDQVLETWPQTVAVFQAYKTACVGCTMAPFDTLADVALIYKLNLADFLLSLEQAANGAYPPSGVS